MTPHTPRVPRPITAYARTWTPCPTCTGDGCIWPLWSADTSDWPPIRCEDCVGQGGWFAEPPAVQPPT